MNRKLIVSAFLAGVIAFASCTKDNPNNGENVNVPERVQQEFKNRYPQVKDVHWDFVKDYHVARFNAPAGTKATAVVYTSSAWFKQDGQFCQSDEDIEFNELPVIVQDAFNKYKETMYPDWRIEECEILSREGMEMVYVIEIEKGDDEREISVSETGDILKDVLDDDDEDDILPVEIPEEVIAALQKIFPDTYSTITIYELEIEDGEIEIDIKESGRHKEVLLDAYYKLISIEYDVTFEEMRQMMDEKVFNNLLRATDAIGLDLNDKKVQEEMEIEAVITESGLVFEIEVEEADGTEYEIFVDETGRIFIEEDD